MLSLGKAVSTPKLVASMPFLLLEKSKRLISQGRGEQGENTESVLACVSAGNQVTLSLAGRGRDLHSEFQVRKDYIVKARRKRGEMGRLLQVRSQISPSSMCPEREGFGEGPVN